MTVLTAADFADTGQWRLIINIHATGISAYLENTIHADVELQPLFSSEWEEDSANLLTNIENAVYDHPRVLDDFATRINIFSRDTLFVPSTVLDENEGSEESLFNTVFDADPNDVMTDRDGDITAVYASVPGLKGFILRTFPGSRTSCHLMREVARKRSNNEGYSMHLCRRKNETDFILLKDSDLISASTRMITDQNDIAYFTFNLLDTYKIDPISVNVNCIGFEPSDEFKSLLYKFTGNQK